MTKKNEMKAICRKIHRKEMIRQNLASLNNSRLSTVEDRIQTRLHIETMEAGMLIFDAMTLRFSKLKYFQNLA